MGSQPPSVARLSMYNSSSPSGTSSPVPVSASTNASRFSVATSASGHPQPTSYQMHTNVPATKSRSAIYDRNLNKNRMGQVSLSAYAFLLSEIVQYTQKRVSGIGDLERRLSTIGYRIGLRVSEVLVWRNDPTKNPKREIKLIQALMFIHTQVWKAVFGKPADALERGLEKDDEYMIIDNDPIITRYISIPKDMSQLSCSALTAGLVEAVLDGLAFPARVTAHSVPTDAHPLRTTILIKLDPVVLEREDALK